MDAHIAMLRSTPNVPGTPVLLRSGHRRERNGRAAVHPPARSVPAARTVSLIALVVSLVLALVGLAPLPAQAPSTRAPSNGGLAPGAQHIGRDELLQHARALAGDEMRGRLTGTAEQAKAAEYVAQHFQSLGLEPYGDTEKDGARGWLQRYPVVRTSLAEGTGFRFGDDRIDEGFAVLPWRDDEPVQAKGPLVLLDGNPRDTDDLADKVPLLLVRTHAGKGISINQQFGFSFAFLQRLTRMARSAERAGAKALVVGLLDDDAAVASVLNYLSVAPHKPSVVPGPELADLVGEGNQMSMLVRRTAVPLVFTSARVTGALLERLGTTAEAARAWIFDEGEKPSTKPGPMAALHLELVRETVDATNVVGLLRGSDPALAKEAVVFSAHMDHVGERLDGDAFNGADDNASGSAGLLAIASAFAGAERPKRSVIFLSVSGEELGLWGSAWYANHPTWPVEDMVAAINTDMIGRGGPDAALGQVMLTPSHKHPKYSSMALRAAEAAGAAGLELVADDQFYARSDHINFIQKGIPAVFFCSAGEHEDYHQVSDHVDKLDGEQMEKIARLAYHVGWSVANAEGRPSVIGRRRSWLAEDEEKGERRR